MKALTLLLCYSLALCIWSGMWRRYMGWCHLIFSACLVYTTWEHLPSPPLIPRLGLYVAASVCTACHLTNMFMVSFTIFAKRHTADIILQKGEITIKLRQALGVSPGQYINLRIIKGLYSALNWPMTVIVGSEEPMQELELFIEPRTSLSNHLQRLHHSFSKAQNASGPIEPGVRQRALSTMKLMTAFSGPYGETVPVGIYSNIIWLSFGPLISSMTPYLIQIVREAKKSSLVVWQVKSKGSFTTP